MTKYSLLYATTENKLSQQDTTAMCQCIFKEQEAVAFFVGNALHLEYVDEISGKTIKHLIAGSPRRGGTQDGPGLIASFSGVTDITYVPVENSLIVCDYESNSLRSVILKHPFEVQTICSQTAGIIINDDFCPYSLCVSANGFEVYVTDYDYNTVRKIDIKHGTIATILGGAARTTYVGDPADISRCTLLHPMSVKMDITGQYLYVVNIGRNCICKLKIIPENDENRRLVSVFACAQGSYSLATVIHPTPSGNVVVWRRIQTKNQSLIPHSDTWSDQISDISLYDPCNDTILFQKRVHFTPKALVLRHKIAGTIMYVLKRDQSGGSRFLFKSKLTISCSVVRLLYLAMQKPCEKKNTKNTSKTFAILSKCTLEYIISFINDPFRLTYHQIQE